jgi:hypothetical protein
VSPPRSPECTASAWCSRAVAPGPYGRRHLTSQLRCQRPQRFRYRPTASLGTSPLFKTLLCLFQRCWYLILRPCAHRWPPRLNVAYRPYQLRANDFTHVYRRLTVDLSSRPAVVLASWSAHYAPRRVPHLPFPAPVCNRLHEPSPGRPACGPTGEDGPSICAFPPRPDGTGHKPRPVEFRHLSRPLLSLRPVLNLCPYCVQLGGIVGQNGISGNSAT